MKRIILMMLVILIAFSGVAMADNGPSGPAPNSGDGVSDGSGMDSPSGPNGDGQGEDGPGPAPNSGDGVSDGPGW
jgi:hypothetical protein